jgi:hypothetical protein
MPHRGELCRFTSHSTNDVRRVEVTGFERFSLFYRVDTSTNLTLILLIVHEARNIETLLTQSF